MELGHNRVWDYVADNYVHRLIQNKTDGKLVQLDEGGRAVGRHNSRELRKVFQLTRKKLLGFQVNQDEKVDSITLEVGLGAYILKL